MDLLYIASVALDEVAELSASGNATPTALQRHDAKYHPDGYDEKHDYCTYRNRLKKGDSADLIDPEDVAGEWESIYRVYEARRNKHGKSSGTEEERRAYNATKTERARKGADANLRRTASELMQTFTDEDVRLANEAMEHALQSSPGFDSSHDEARKLKNDLRKGGKSYAKRTLEELFASLGNKVWFDGIGEVAVDADSADSIVSHHYAANRGVFMFVGAAAILLNLKKVGKASRMFADHKKWKGRDYDSIGLACPFRCGDYNFVGEILLKRTPDGKVSLYDVKAVPKDTVKEAVSDASRSLGMYGGGEEEGSGSEERDAAIPDAEYVDRYLADMRTPSHLAKTWIASRYYQALGHNLKEAWRKYLDMVR